MAAPRGLRNQDCLQALPNPERAAPSERVPAILTAAPSIVLERDAGGAAHPARARGWFLNPAPTTLVGDLRLEPLSRLLRVSRECEPGQVVPFREDVLRLPKEHANFGRTEVVRLRLLQNGLARADDRLGLLDLGLAELHRPLDLSLLAFHREPLRPLEQIAGVAVLSDGDRGPLRAHGPPPRLGPGLGGTHRPWSGLGRRRRGPGRGARGPLRCPGPPGRTAPRALAQRGRRTTRMRVGAAPSSAPRCGMLLPPRSARLRIVVLGTSCELARGAPRPARSRRPRHVPARSRPPDPRRLALRAPRGFRRNPERWRARLPGPTSA